VGADETRGFKQWTADLVASWHAHGAPAKSVELAGRTHFTILDALAEEDGTLARAIRSFIR
jgi:hypothetical protein